MNVPIRDRSDLAFGNIRTDTRRAARLVRAPEQNDNGF